MIKWKKKMIIAAVCLFCLPLQVIHAADKKWYQDNQLVAHALGAVGDKKETNSKEAFLESWSQGYKVLEVDFSLTNDGVLVARHDFNQDSYFQLEQTVRGNIVMTAADYKNQKINFRYTPLTAVELFQLMNEYPDIYLISDTKLTDLPSVTKQFEALKAYAEGLGTPEVLDRLIVQIYNEEMYNTVKGIYPFKNWIYTLYQTPNPDYDAIGTFCAQNGIEVVAMDQELVRGGGVAILKQKGVKVYAHTVNRMLEFKNMLNAGCYGVYTDYIKPKDLSLAGITRPSLLSKVMVRSKQQDTYLSVCQIQGVQYVRLRDVAAMLKGTSAAFSSSYNMSGNILQLKKGGEFVSIGNEMLINSGDAQYVKQSVALTVDGKALEETAYTIDGEYYFQLEALGTALGFTVVRGDVPTELLLTIEEEKA